MMKHSLIPLLSAILLAVLLWLPVSHASCPPAHRDKSAQVSLINDGDTLETTDGARIRFIGINTPEIGRHGKASEPYAEQASRLLRELIARSGNRIVIQYGPMRHDHYHRTLAHVFLPDGRNLLEILLKKGLAYRILFMPNDWGQNCYKRAEHYARLRKLGVWSVQPRQPDSLPEKARGFFLIQGLITRVGHSKKSVWLNFNGNFAVRIARRDLHYFNDINLDQLKHRRIEVRGWVHPYKGQNILRLRHSSMMQIVK